MGIPPAQSGVSGEPYSNISIYFRVWNTLQAPLTKRPSAITEDQAPSSYFSLLPLPAPGPSFNSSKISPICIRWGCPPALHPQAPAVISGTVPARKHLPDGSSVCVPPAQYHRREQIWQRKEKEQLICLLMPWIIRQMEFAL